MKIKISLIFLILFSFTHLYAEVEELVVTGTLLKNTEQDSSPIDIISEEDYKNALINFVKASELDPKVGAYYYSIGIVKTYLDDKVGACYQFSKALKYGYIEAQEVIDSYCKSEKKDYWERV